MARVGRGCSKERPTFAKHPSTVPSGMPPRMAPHTCSRPGSPPASPAEAGPRSVPPPPPPRRQQRPHGHRQEGKGFGRARSPHLPCSLDELIGRPQTRHEFPDGGHHMGSCPLEETHGALGPVWQYPPPRCKTPLTLPAVQSSACIGTSFASISQPPVNQYKHARDKITDALKRAQPLAQVRLFHPPKVPVASRIPTSHPCRGRVGEAGAPRPLPATLNPARFARPRGRCIFRPPRPPRSHAREKREGRDGAAGSERVRHLTPSTCFPVQAGRAELFGGT